MFDYYIVFSSITFASRVKRYFIGNDRDIALMHTPKSIPVNGCSYSLRVRKRRVRSILLAADKMGIQTKGIFVENNGEFEGVNYDIFR